MRSLLLASTAILLAHLCVGCIEEQRYVTPPGGGVWTVAIDESTPAFFESEELTLYIVEREIRFPVRAPTDEEWQRDVSGRNGLDIPYDRRPFLRRHDYEIQIDWTLSNLGDARINASLIVNGINEFHQYNPGVTLVDDEFLVDFAQWERLYVLNPGERLTGTIREDEMDEVAVDLATVVGVGTNADGEEIRPNPNQVVYFENHSADEDPRYRDFIPELIPALLGVRVGIRSTSPTPLLLEATVRMRDRGAMLAPSEREEWETVGRRYPQMPELFGPANAMVAAPVP